MVQPQRMTYAYKVTCGKKKQDLIQQYWPIAQQWCVDVIIKIHFYITFYLYIYFKATNATSLTLGLYEFVLSVVDEDNNTATDSVWIKVVQGMYTIVYI